MSHIDWLYNSVARVERPTTRLMPSGKTRTSYVTVNAYMRCRLDITFLRPGKDQPTPQEGGAAPDRTGVLFCDYDEDLRASDRLVMIENEWGKIPIPGIFTLKVHPDIAQELFDADHLEVQVVEEQQQNIAEY